MIPLRPRWCLAILTAAVVVPTAASHLTGCGAMVSGLQGHRGFAMVGGRIASVNFEQVGGDIDVYFGGRVPRERRIGDFYEFQMQRSDRLGLWSLDPVQGQFFMEVARAEGRPILPVWPLAITLIALTGWSWRPGRRVPAPGCAGCGYDLTGLAALAPCPECGTARA